MQRDKGAYQTQAIIWIKGRYVARSLVMALNSGLYLVYLARTKAFLQGNSTSSTQFLNTGLLPSKAGPIISTELPMFATLPGLLPGITLGTWLGLRTPKPRIEAL